jgi:hypothetical protein
VRVFENVEGRLRDRTEAWGLSSYRGWWNGVATGDFNGDGRPDIVAANWGRNTPYESFRGRPLRIHAADLDRGATTRRVSSRWRFDARQAWRWCPMSRFDGVKLPNRPDWIAKRDGVM